MKFPLFRTACCGLLFSASLLQAQTTEGLLFRSTEGNMWQLEEGGSRKLVGKNGFMLPR